MHYNLAVQSEQVVLIHATGEIKMKRILIRAKNDVTSVTAI